MEDEEEIHGNRRDQVSEEGWQVDDEGGNYKPGISMEFVVLIWKIKLKRGGK